MHVFLIAAVTLDGFIAQTKNQKSTQWTSKADADYFRARSKQAGALVMGATTFATIGGPMQGRKVYVLTRSPEDFEGYHRDQVEPVALPLEELVNKVEAEGFKELAVCGGASVYHQFMAAGLVQTLYLTVEPKLFGKGIKLFSGNLAEVELKLKKVKKLSEQTILLEYQVK